MKLNELIGVIKPMTTTADDNTAVKGMELYEAWKPDTTYKVGDRRRYGGVLHKCISDHTSQTGWRPGQDTASLWTAIDVTHAGTLEDPIPFALNMEVFKDKYYSWQGKAYLCTRDSGQALQNPPGQLIGHYFTEA